MSKLIVITGVSRGLGLAMTEQFIQLGHTVLGCARSAEAIASLQTNFGKPHDFEQIDVTDDAKVKTWSDRLLSQYGTPDLLINNAAVINPSKPLWQISSADFDTVIDVNIKGVANTIRHFVPAMIQRQQGIIINFSSGWGRSTSPDVAPYCATKWAIEGLTQALAQELPSGMAAIPLNPGIINTEMLKSCFGEGSDDFISAQTWGKKAVPFILKISAKDNGRSLSVPT